MKIKSWLLLTYLLVMILPLLALYGLYVSINDYYQDKSLDEYFEKWTVVSDIKDYLDNPSLYTINANYKEIEKLTSDQLMITLYSPNGKIYYSSNLINSLNGFESKSAVYKSLFEFKQNYETFVYKEPVYEDGKIKGVYKITLVRSEWLEQVNTKSLIVVTSLIVVMLLLYGAVVYMLNRRLNKPVKRLMEQMRAFAKDEATSPLPVKKDEIGELTESFQLMQQEITATRKKLALEQQQKEFMIASLSHDLKTPLTSIQAYAESLRHGNHTEKDHQEYLQIIQSKSDYMKQLLDDLMMLTLLQSPTYELELVKVEGEEFFDMLLGDYEQISKEKGFEAKTTANVEGSYLVNPKQLMRVVDNVVANAWTYTNPGGAIYISAFETMNIPAWSTKRVADNFTEKGVYIVVQNSGVTISEQQCEQMFEPLYQFDVSRSHIGERGAGLGLSIAKQIIAKHNGTIKAKTQQEQLAIVIWLPPIEEEGNG
ncbi:two-component sensor histidine kinase [Solibacillus silvestris]|nr:HAMP domain-containing sensor histidine kinase [Solibacillus silvestris]OBW51697.1 two-component sensor histidine kinase [Solibacillus silvestris]